MRKMAQHREDRSSVPPKRRRDRRAALRYGQGAALLTAAVLLIFAAWQADTLSGDFSVASSDGSPAAQEPEAQAEEGAGVSSADDPAAGGNTSSAGNAAAGGSASSSDVPAAGGKTFSAENTAADGSASSEPKRAALTFDDGPHPTYTATLLDGLKERQIRATFFVIGENIPGNEALIARMAEEGHLIGNHTWDHVKISDLDTASACEEVEKTSALVRSITGQDTEFVRPPFGEWNKALETSFVMIPVLWDVDPLDWTTKNTATVVRRVLEDVEDGDIILLHDCYASSVEAALQIADTLTAQGWEFVTVDELILE